MRAMILAAGRGERMRPLTDRTPKPLLQVGGKALIVWHLERLAQAGISQVVINHAWLGEQIERELGDGARFGVQIAYSPEAQALETAGGIRQALPLLGSEPFLLINGDIWCDWDPGQARALALGLAQGPTPASAWLLLVDNPAHHPQGDFGLDGDGVLRDGDSVLRESDGSRHDSDGIPHDSGPPRLTYAGLGIYRPELFAGLAAGVAAPLAPLLRQAIARGALRGAHHSGNWVDVGTVQRLQALDRMLGQQAGAR